MRSKLPALFSLILVLHSVQSEEFNLSPAGDAAAAVIAVSVFAAGEVIVYTSKPPGFFPPVVEINPVDRLAIFEYSKSLGTVSDVTQFLSSLAPVLTFVSRPRSSVISITAIYLESVFFSFGVKDILKGLIKRYRPYMYQESVPAKLAADRDRYLSFPSGHTTMAFTGASFASYVFWILNPDSKWKVPVSILSFGLASTTAVFRVLSGNHFISDVLAGACLGSLSGFLVPFFHLDGPERNDVYRDPSKVNVHFTGDSVVLCLKL